MLRRGRAKSEQSFFERDAGFGRGGVAIVRVTLQETVADGRCVRRDQVGRKLRNAPVSNGLRGDERSGLVERNHSRERLVENEPQAVKVGASVDRARLVEMLRAHVEHRAGEALFARFDTRARNAEVGQQSLVLFADEDVRRFDVPMDESPLVTCASAVAMSRAKANASMGSSRPSAFFRWTRRSDPLT